MKSRSVSITGATGFFGWHIATEFLGAGWRVRGIVRPASPRPLPAAVERVEASLDGASLRAAVAGSDLVVHSAGVARSRSNDFEAVNVNGTRSIVEAVNRTGARLVLISSQAAVGTGTSTRPSEENDVPRPLTAYGRSKLAGEEIVRTSAGVPWTILRPCSIYGPRDRQFLPMFRLAARGRLLLVSRPSAMFTMIDVADAARAVVLASENERAVGQTFFIGHPTPQSGAAILAELACIAAHAGTPLRIPAAVVWAAALGGELAWLCGFEPIVDLARGRELRSEGFVCSVARARAELGFNASTSLAEGFARTWQWYREQGWI